MMSCGYSRFARPGWHGFGMIARSGRFFGPGEVRLALLSLLTEAPVHGYELMKQLEERSGGVYRASAGTVYPTLQQLEDEGLITSELRDGKKVYRLTDEGRRELEERDESVREIWRRARRWEDWRSAFDPDASEIRGPANGWSKRRSAPWRERARANGASSGCARSCSARYANLKSWPVRASRRRSRSPARVASFM